MNNRQYGAHLTLTDARCKIEVWRIHYNQSCPHSALDWMAPREFAENLPVARICS
ncbi:transposase [Raoultella ornithinolytica]